MVDPVAAMDQFQALLGGMSEVWRSYYERLRAQGFNEDQAFQMVRDAQKEVLRLAVVSDG